jgi:hypothetical protein
MKGIISLEEEIFVLAFIVPNKRDRYLQMLANPSKRKKILGLLHHNLDTIASLTTRIENRDHTPKAVEKILRQKGARQTCYLISPEQELDRQEIPLQEAIEILVAHDSTAVACCVPGRLAYYKAETQQYILENTH